MVHAGHGKIPAGDRRQNLELRSAAKAFAASRRGIAALSESQIILYNQRPVRWADLGIKRHP